MWKRRQPRTDEAWVSTAPRPKDETPEQPRSREEHATYEDHWYEVLRRSRGREPTAEEG